ncbi:Mitochondrial distribution and morphology protein 34 [Rhodotorula toruloides]|nr:Mitochondrial distribution and morphology protein 34 [Rhodotorula toruloides]
MSFQFEWPEFSEAFYEDAREMLAQALNKGQKPPIIADRIEVKELNMGTIPPDLEILEIGDLSTDRFRGIFRLTYSGDAYIVLQTKVQANPLNVPRPSLDILNAPRILFAAAPLIVPMTLRLSSLSLRAIVVLVVSRQKGITLVFKNDPLESVNVSSSFDGVESVAGFIQSEIENQLREAFRSDLPSVIHRLSQKWLSGEVRSAGKAAEGMGPKARVGLAKGFAKDAKIETRTAYEAGAGEGVGAKKGRGYSRNISGPSEAGESVELDSQADSTWSTWGGGRMGSTYSASSAFGRSASLRRLNTASTSPSPAVPHDMLDSVPESIENYDPTYGLRPDSIPHHAGFADYERLVEARSSRRGLGDVLMVVEEDDEDPFLAHSSHQRRRSADELDFDDELGDVFDDPGARNSFGPLDYRDEFETIPAVGGGTITRPRVFHTQSQMRVRTGSTGSLTAHGSPSTATARSATGGSTASTVGLGRSTSLSRLTPLAAGLGAPSVSGASSARFPFPRVAPPPAYSASLGPGGFLPRNTSLPNLSRYPSSASTAFHRSSLPGTFSSSSHYDYWRNSNDSTPPSSLTSPALPPHPPPHADNPPSLAFSRPSPVDLLSRSPSSVLNTSYEDPDASHLPIVLNPNGNDSCAHLATLTSSNQTLSPFTRDHSHVKARSEPYVGGRLAPTAPLAGQGQGRVAIVPSGSAAGTAGSGSAQGPTQSVKAVRKRLHRIGSAKVAPVAGSATPSLAAPPTPSLISASAGPHHRRTHSGFSAFPPPSSLLASSSRRSSSIPRSTTSSAVPASPLHSTFAAAGFKKAPSELSDYFPAATAGAREALSRFGRKLPPAPPSEADLTHPSASPDIALQADTAMSAAQVSRSVVKKVLAVETPEGAGATVRRSIGTAQLRNFTPFLMLDNFLVKEGAGFPDHPHRGMTTLTYMLEGEFEHEDSKGNKGKIGPGDLQFMIAGRGLVHAEMPIHGPGKKDPFGLQLWIDLPARYKNVEASYQDRKASEVASAHPTPNVEIKVVCGESQGSEEEGIVKGNVRPLGGCWFMDFIVSKKGERVFQQLPVGWNAFVYTLEGETLIGPSDSPRPLKPVEQYHTAVLSNSDSENGVWFESASNKARFVLVAGEPLKQGVVQHGPFVATSREGIQKAFLDYQMQKNGFEGAHSWRSEIGKRSQPVPSTSLVSRILISLSPPLAVRTVAVPLDTGSPNMALHNSEPNCIFCKIIKGDIPSFKLIETDAIYSFLDIGPLSKGHALVIPKYHAPKLHDVPDEHLGEILATLKKIAVAQGVENYNILQNNGKIAHQVVDHVHFHMIPKPSDSDKEGLVIGWPAQQANMDELKNMASRVLSRASTLENKLDSLSIHDEAPPEQLKRTSVAHKPANPKLAPIRPSNAAAPSSTLSAQPTSSAPSSSNINRQPSLKLATANSAASRASNATGGKLRVPNGPGANAGGAGTGLQSKFRGGGANGGTSPGAASSSAAPSTSTRPLPTGTSSRTAQPPSSSSPPPSDVPSDIGTYDGGFERDEQRREKEREAAGGGQAIRGEAVKILAMDSSAAGPHRPTQRFSLSSFEIGKPLGKGKFGRVYMARTLVEPKYIVALKCLHKEELVKNRVEKQFEWPEFSEAFYEDAREMLAQALNKGQKPPIIADRIEVKELNMGTIPPDLEILEIGDLSTDRFRGIFRLTYSGDAYIVLQTKVQANPLNVPRPSLDILNAPRILFAAAPLIVPMTLRLSSLSLRAIVVLVVSRQKGITLVFKNDPLESVNVSSSFDGVESVAGFIQSEIENQLREAFRSDLPSVIHRLSQKWLSGEVRSAGKAAEGMGPKARVGLAKGFAKDAKIETRTAYEAGAGEGVGAKKGRGYSRNISGPSEAGESVELDSQADSTWSTWGGGRMGSTYSASSAFGRSASLRRLNTASTSPSPAVPHDMLDSVPESIENYDPTYGLRPDSIPHHAGFADYERLVEARSSRRGLGDVLMVVEEDDEDPFLAHSSHQRRRSADELDFDDELGDVFDDPGARNSFGPLDYRDEFETIPAVGGGTITRPRVFHTQSQMRVRTGSTGSLTAHGSPSTATARSATGGSTASTVGLGRSTSLSRLTPLAAGLGAPSVSGASSARFPFPRVAPPPAYSASLGPGGFLPRNTSLPNLSRYPSSASTAFHRSSLPGTFSSSSHYDYWRNSNDSTPPSSLTSPALPPHPPPHADNPPSLAFSRPSPVDLLSRSPSSVLNTSYEDPDASHLPIVLNPNGNDSCAHLATLTSSNQTLSPFTRDHSHVKARSEPYVGGRLAPTAPLAGQGQGRVAIVPSGSAAGTAGSGSAQGPTQSVKAVRKRLHRIGSAKVAPVAGSATPSLAAPPTPSLISASAGPHHRRTHSGFSAFPPPSSLLASSSRRSSSIPRSTTSSAVPASPLHSTFAAAGFKKAPSELSDYFPAATAGAREALSRFGRKLPPAPPSEADLTHPSASPDIALQADTAMSAAQVSRSVVKKVLAVETPEGAGATVRRSIGTAQLRNFTPFLMLDNFLVKEGAGFPDHPHRGMTTLTYMLEGEFEHEDSKGNKGKIGPGDLQFMIAGRGLVHAEMPIHGPGKKDPFGLQLWIDLPARYKNVEASYQDRKASEVASAHPTPNVEIKVVCGESQGSEEEGIVKGNVRPLGGCWFMDFIVSKKGERVFQQLPVGWNAFVYTLEGETLIGPSDSPRPLKPVEQYHTAVLSNSDSENGVWFESASNKARFVLVAGEPLKQGVVQHGPFVATSREGIQKAFLDYQMQKNGFEGAHSWRSEIGKRSQPVPSTSLVSRILISLSPPLAVRTVAVPLDTGSPNMALHNSEPNCIFCKIIKGDIPSFKLIETDAIYSFLDIGPLSKGHALVIPKCPPLSHTLNLALADKRCALGTDHAPKLHDVPDEHLGEILATLKKIAVAQGVENYNILQNNGKIAHQVVDHVHFHMIPKPSDSDKEGLVIGWPAQQANMDELKKYWEEVKGKL